MADGHSFIRFEIRGQFVFMDIFFPPEQTNISPLFSGVMTDVLGQP